MTNPFSPGPAQPQQPAPPAPSEPSNPFSQPQQQAPAQTFPGQVSAAEVAAFQAQQNGGQVQQQFAPQQAPNGYAQGGPVAPQGLPGQPWSPAQHQQNVPQAYAPPVAPQQQAPAPAPQGLPQAPFPGQQAQGFGGGFPGAQAQQGGGFDPSMFGAPSAGGGGLFPKVRDLENRLCLFRVKNRNAVGTAYEDKTKSVTNYTANVAVLDGGPLYSSPNQDEFGGQPTLVSETVPYVVADLTIGQVGIQGRLKQDFVRGRVVRMPKGNTEKGLMEAFPGMEAWQALATWLSQDPANVSKLGSGTFFWGIVPDDSDQANRLVQAFAQNPISRELML